MITVTTAAAEHIKKALTQRGRGLGIRMGVKPAGCSGWSYITDFVDTPDQTDKVFESQGIKVFVNPDSLTLVDGIEIDFVKEGLNQHFAFNNPNAKDACGCGESFNV